MKPTAYDGKPSQAYNHRKYDNNGKDWYFRLAYDNKMRYEYIHPLDHLNLNVPVKHISRRKYGRQLREPQLQLLWFSKISLGL